MFSDRYKADIHNIFFIQKFQVHVERFIVSPLSRASPIDLWDTLIDEHLDSRLLII